MANLESYLTLNTKNERGGEFIINGQTVTWERCSTRGRGLILQKAVRLDFPDGVSVAVPVYCVVGKGGSLESAEGVMRDKVETDVLDCVESHKDYYGRDGDIRVVIQDGDIISDEDKGGVWCHGNFGVLVK